MLVQQPPYDSVQALIEEVQAAVNLLAGDLRQLGDKIHDHPELAYHEHYAHRLLSEYMTQQGFDVAAVKELDTAFIATYHVSGTGPARTIGFLYDALPDIGHGCGHNLIAISGVAAAIGCVKACIKFNIKATIKLYGTPAEESGSAKVAMVEAGYFDDADICIMCHPSRGSLYAPQHLSLQSLQVRFHGKASHASATPWRGINALDAVVTAYQSIGLLRQQIYPTQRIHGIITNGGAAPNVIPELTEANYYVRSKRHKDLPALRDRVENCFAAAAAATGCTFEIERGAFVMDVNTNMTLALAWADVVRQLGFKFAPVEKQLQVSRGSTDMGNVTWHRPGLHAIYDIETTANAHSKDFADAARTDKAFQHTLTAAIGLAVVGVRAAAEDEFLRLVQEEFAKSKKEDARTAHQSSSA
ncbi:hypothetical protein THASP1DRAFT_32398 [Thamnocephalis sphaerospora]|uniref:Peptidase M20 domain-containing protein 2 n=1 Tax=Thamnocephalis sphaerospora TaxID=78915 RepID=A0A4P9XK50_9FUNG|nr:hypothetical protein THASP1DRAFT_32398 [Thamnocephalis sphaerospora]|eukprot:RKP05771.1 hypothetical protein THASP1DRAFT_32398 [Thamnocephalis sphaerospora]